MWAHVHQVFILSVVFYLDDFDDGRLILQSTIQNHAYHISNWEVLNDFTSRVNYIPYKEINLIIFYNLVESSS